MHLYTTKERKMLLFIHLLLYALFINYRIINIIYIKNKKNYKKGIKVLENILENVYLNVLSFISLKRYQES